MHDTGDKEISIFCCKVVGHLYAFQVTDITNVLESDQLMNSAIESSLIMDLASMNNKQIPVVDLGKILHDIESNQSFGSNIIVVKNWYQEYVFEIGLYIDSVVGVYDAQLSLEGTIQPLDENGEKMKSKNMILLDPQIMFSYEEKGLLFYYFKSTDYKEEEDMETQKQRKKS